MKNIYVKLLNETKDYVWIKLIMNYENDLNLNSIVMSINQMLINNSPMDVFFEFPNILLSRVSPILYRNFSPKSNVRDITTKDQDYAYEIRVESYHLLKDTIYGMIGIDSNREANDGTNAIETSNDMCS